MQNRNLRLYADAIRDVAEQRNLAFVDLYDLLDSTRTNPRVPLTDNGIHLTALGYWRSAPVLLKGLGLADSRWRIDVSANRAVVKAEGVKVEKVEKSPLRFEVLDDLLPPPPPPMSSSTLSPLIAEERLLRVRQLPSGKYTLSIDGTAILTATATEWGAGIQLVRGPEFDQVEQLRQTIVEKNRLYFHRWRPQNETYLFGFRKREQGQNAREIPQFDPLVEKQEQEIARLRVPVAHVYELKEEAK